MLKMLEMMLSSTGSLVGTCKRESEASGGVAEGSAFFGAVGNALDDLCCVFDEFVLDWRHCFWKYVERGVESGHGGDTCVCCLRVQIGHGYLSRSLEQWCCFGNYRCNESEGVGCLAV